MVEQHFCLRWNNYRTNITAEFETLREGEHFVDVTLACDGKQLKAHKVVLSACSPYFKELLQGNPCSHPIIILRDVAYTHMRSLLEFMYAGEVNISQAHLGSFLHTAEALKIRGLAESSDESKNQARGSNSISPLTALKTSLGNFGGISLGGLGSSILDRAVIPQLSSHSGDPLAGSTQPLASHLVPPSLSLPSTSFASPSSSSSGLPSTTAGGSSPDKTSIGETHSQGPIPLTVNTHSNDLGTRIKGETGEPKESTSPLSLPPNKRLRLEPRLGHHLISTRDTGGEKAYEHPQNGCSFTPSSNSSASPTDTGALKLSTTQVTASNALSSTEGMLDTVPKTEPIDQPVSDTEGSGGWPDEGESGSGGVGRDSYTPPDPSSLNHPNASSGIAVSESENTSHLLQALSSESHLPGSSHLDGERIYPPEDCHQDLRSDMREVRERMSSSPPLPPSSLPHSCQLCGKLISCRRNLWKHMERVHFTNPAVRCSLCAKMFKNKYALKDHQRIYHGGLSEPSHIPPQHSASLLSRILQDSRHHHSQDHPSIPHPPHLPPPHHTTHSHSHHQYPRRQPEEKDHPAQPPGGGGSSYSSIGITPLLPPHSLAPPVVGTHPQNSGRSQAPSEWTAPENPYSMVNRSLLTELHHMVTKAE